ncbi:hypothetical protein GW17_00038819 [Ensete ventricosum]|nr:hypothetical protein GW17_00038819 [Ensete ventricosum]
MYRLLSGGIVKIGISPSGNEMPPRLPAGERGVASSSSGRTRDLFLFKVLSILVDKFFFFYSRYNFGWSHGKEKLESGKVGKFYC